jgi:hypothetical protein
MNDKAKPIFLNARRYSESSWILNKTGKPGLLLASWVNGALALELYFKALYCCINGKDFKLKDAKGKEHSSHDFLAIFDSLDSEARSALESSFSEQLRRRDMSDVDALDKHAEISPVPRDLRGNLKAWSSVFVNVRYVYEASGKEIPMMFFPEIEYSVLHAIYSERPEWNS